MLAQEFFVDIDTGAVTGGATITGLPGLVGIMGAALNLKVAFKTAGVVGPLASYDYAKLVLKGDLDHDDEPVFFADAPALSGTETATRYTFAALCDSLEMRALVEGKNELVVKGQIEVKLTAEVEPRVSRPFDVQLINCYSRSTDGAPSAADEAAWAWLKARLAEGDNIQFAYNEETRVLTIAADLSGIEVEGVLDLKGDINATANPNYPVAEKGDCYYITHAGKVGGASGKAVDVGDLVIAKADNAGGAQGSVGSSWFVVERNLAITSFGSLLIQEPDAAAVRQLLQLRLGIDVQEHRNELARYGLHAGDIASDGTVPVTSINGDFARITGTDPIGNLSDAPLGTIRTLLFQDSLNLVHSGSLSLPGADDILTAAGDVAIFRSVGVDTWLCVAYTRADGTAVVGSGGGGDPITQSNTAWVDPAGNDGTGEMSNPAKPFATWAGVLAALTTETHLTVMWGVAGPETGDLPDLDITVIGYGVGAPASGLTLLIPDNNTGGSLRVVNTQLAALGTDGAIDAVGDWHFYGIEVDGDIDFETVAGTAASHNAEDGSPGGGMGSLTFHHCYATGGLNLTTGSGGSGWEAEGEPSTNGGQAGDIAALRFERCGFEDGLNLTTGTGGDGGNGATGGDGGDLGSIFLDQQCSFRITTSYGNGGAAVSGTPGANGMVTGTYAHPRPHLQSLPGASESTDAVNLQDLQNALVLYIPTAAIVTASGTTLTLGTNHNGRYVRLTNASSCTITLPNQSTASWVANTEITIRVAAAGIPTFSLGAGVTLNDPLGLMSSLATGSTFMIKRVTSDVWDLI